MTTRNTLGVVAFLGAFVLATGPASAQSVEQFYKNKQIKIIVSTGAGGGYDSNARTLGFHMGKHIPGKPTFFVQNMPGAGGLRASNNLYFKAPKDGTVLGVVHHAMTTASVYGLKGARFDSFKFNWIGSIAGEPNLVVAWHTSPVKTFDDLLKKPFVVGGTGAGSFFEIVPRVLNKFFGTKIKVISGYKGSSRIKQAMEQNEVEGISAWALSSVRNSHPGWLRDKKINLIVQLGTNKHPDLPNVPLIMDYAKSKDEKSALSLIFASQQFLRTVLAPPGVPKARVKALRGAFMATMKDKAFRADMAKRRLPLAPLSGKQLTKKIEGISATPKNIVNMAKSAMFPRAGKGGVMAR